MQVVEKMHHIDVTITGVGADIIKTLIQKQYPNALVKDSDNDDDFVKFEETDLYREIKTNMTPGSLLSAYRSREGLSLTELAKHTGISYTNISAMENDRRVIGLHVAKKLAKALKCEYTDLLNV